MTAEIVACVLCLRGDSPMTREHVFARWLVRQVRGGQLLASGAVPSVPPVRISRVTTLVCADCNAGWMSTLEVSFRQTLFARPRVGRIQPPERLTLSRWFTKTAVLLADARGTVLLGAAQRAQLVRGMPDEAEVFVARRRRPQQHLDFAVNAAAAGDDDAGGRESGVRSVAILVDDLVAHVASRGTLASRHGTRLWPLRSHTLRWDTLPVIAASTRADQ